MALVVGPAWSAPLHFEWRGAFSDAEQQRLRHWVTTTYAGVADLVGPLSIPIRVEVHRQANASEPVPWAQTLRRRPQGIRLYVDPTFDDAALLDDWTVAHELSHLILPCLGRSEAWFSEGFASFMQFRVLEAMGRIDDGHAQQLIDRRIDRARADPLIASTPFAHAGSKLRGAGRYPTLYWGGAAYIAQIDAGLRARDQSLDDVLRRYLACCREDFASIESLTAVLDELSDTTLFTQTLRQARHRPGLPAPNALIRGES